MTTTGTWLKATIKSYEQVKHPATRLMILVSVLARTYACRSSAMRGRATRGVDGVPGGRGARRQVRYRCPDAEDLPFHGTDIQPVTHMRPIHAPRDMYNTWIHYNLSMTQICTNLELSLKHTSRHQGPTARPAIRVANDAPYPAVTFHPSLHFHSLGHTVVCVRFRQGHAEHSM